MEGEKAAGVGEVARLREDREARLQLQLDEKGQRISGHRRMRQLMNKIQAQEFVTSIVRVVVCLQA